MAFTPTPTRLIVQWSGLIAGPILALLCFALLPDEYLNASDQLVPFSDAGRMTTAIMVWMAIWWLTEAINVSVTALLPVVLFPLLGASDIRETSAPYAHPLIFLFMGGFLLALSMQRWGLDRRIALTTLRAVGTRPANMVGGFMAATAVLSAFVSNVATTAMMLPIALSVIQLVRQEGNQHAPEGESADVGMHDDQRSNFAICMLLGLAYAASIGGVATIIGTAPNTFLVGFVSNSIAEPYRIEISFAGWMLIGVPFVVLFLPIVWLVLTRVMYPVRIGEIKGGGEFVQRELDVLGRINRGEWLTMIVFACTAFCWITRRLLVQIEWTIGGETVSVFGGLTDPGIAMTGALALFVIPVDVRRRQFVMNWATAQKLPWGILLLFGGGLSLAAAIQVNGVAEFIGSQTRFFSGMPTFAIVLLVTTTVIFLTELTSNTATTATMVPALAAIGPGLGVHPYLLIFPAAIAASCAFMLPIATPPNAIVFGSGQISIPQMMKAGIRLNLIGIVLVTLLAMSILMPVLGLE